MIESIPIFRLRISHRKQLRQMADWRELLSTIPVAIADRIVSFMSNRIGSSLHLTFATSRMRLPDLDYAGRIKAERIDSYQVQEPRVGSIIDQRFEPYSCNTKRST